MADPRRPDDELVSAVLDGEADEATRQRVTADPRLRARLAEFGEVRDAVAAPVDPPDTRSAETTIARALAEHEATGTTAAQGPAEVTDLDRARRRSVVGRRVLVVAAIVAVLALAGGLLVSLDDGTDEASDQATGSSDSAEAGAVEVPDLALGPIAGPEELRRRVVEDTGLDAEEAFGAEAEGDVDGPDPDTGTAGSSADEAAADGSGRSVEDCAVALVESRPRLIGQLAQGTVAYQGTDAYVLVYNDADAAGAVAIVAATVDCRVLAEVPL